MAPGQRKVPYSPHTNLRILKTMQGSSLGVVLGLRRKGPYHTHPHTNPPYHKENARAPGRREGAPRCPARSFPRTCALCPNMINRNVLGFGQRVAGASPAPGTNVCFEWPLTAISAGMQPSALTAELRFPGSRALGTRALGECLACLIGQPMISAHVLHWKSGIQRGVADACGDAQRTCRCTPFTAK